MAINRMTTINSQTLLKLSHRRFSTATAVEAVAAAREPPRRTTTLFDKVSKLRSVADVLDEWARQRRPINRIDLINLVRHFRNHKDYHSALQVSNWSERNKSEVNIAHHAVRIELLYKTEGIASAEEYFNNLQMSTKTIETYGSLLSCLCSEKILDKALEIFEEMKTLNYISTLGYNNMLSLYCSLDQPQKVASLVQEMEEKNIAANIITYNQLINSYGALKDLEAVEGVLEKMKMNNVKCNWLTYRNLVTIYVNFGDHDKANAFLEEMEKLENEPTKRGPETYLTCIKFYSKMNNFPGVKRAWESLKSNFPRPSSANYLTMLLALSRLGELEELEKYFKEWVAGCSYFDYRLPNVLLEYYLSRNMIKEATSFHKNLVQRNSEPNLRTLNSFANLCMRIGEADLALKYLEMGVGQAILWKKNWFPTDETVNLFLNYFEEKKDAARVGKFIESMKKVHRLDSSVYDSLLSSATASNNVGRLENSGAAQSKAFC